mgnify:CR=1 FL=1
MKQVREYAQTDIYTNNTVKDFYLNDLHENNLLIYNERKTKDLEQEIECCNCLVSNYGSKKCPLQKTDNNKERYNTKGEQRGKRFELRCSEKEFQQIEANAKACNKSVSAYIRETALNVCILNPNDSYIEKHTTEISAHRNAVVQLIFTIKKTGNYTPADLEYIVEKTNEMLKSEKELLNIYRNSVESEKKLIARTIRQLAKNNIQKTK